MIWHFADVFETIAALVPDQLALIDGAKRRSWWRRPRQLVRRVALQIDTARSGRDGP